MIVYTQHQGRVHTLRQPRQQGAEAGGNITFAARKQKATNTCCSTTPLSAYIVRISAKGVVPPTVVGLPTSANVIKITSYSHA